MLELVCRLLQPFHVFIQFRRNAAIFSMTLVCYILAPAQVAVDVLTPPDDMTAVVLAPDTIFFDCGPLL